MEGELYELNECHYFYGSNTDVCFELNGQVEEPMIEESDEQQYVIVTGHTDE